MPTKHRAPAPHHLPLFEPLAPNIRLRLHLERVAANDAWESSVLLTSRRGLGSLVSSYRQTPFAVETSLGNPLSRPMSVAEVASALPAFSQANQAAFAEYQNAFADARHPLKFAVPVYDLGDGNYFLLDGNHRSVAAYMAKAELEITLVVLHGPIDRRVLISLKAWDGGLARFWRRLRRMQTASSR